MAPAGPGAPASAALLLPFDLSARQLLSHGSPLASPLPFTWAAASVALEAEIDGASMGLWATSLLPDQSGMALNQPASLVGKQATPATLRALLTPTAEALRAFYLAPLSPARPQALARLLPPSGLVFYLARPGLPLPSAHRASALRPTYPDIAFDRAGASRGPALAALARTSVGLARAREALAAYVTALGTLDRRLASAAVEHSLARADFNLALSKQNPRPSASVDRAAAPFRPALVALARSYLALTRARNTCAAYLPALKALGLRPAHTALHRLLADAALGLSLASARLTLARARALSNQNPLQGRPALARDARLPALEALRRLAGARLGLNLASARLALVLSNQNPLPAAPCGPALATLARSHLRYRLAATQVLNVHWDYRLTARYIDHPSYDPVRARKRHITYLSALPALDRRLARALRGRQLARASFARALSNQNRPSAPCRPALVALAHSFVALTRAREARAPLLPALQAPARSFVALTRAREARAPLLPALQALARSFVALTRAREARLPALQALNFRLIGAIIEHNLASANFTRTLSKQAPWPLAGGVGFAQA